MSTELIVDTREPGVGACSILTNDAVDGLAVGGSFVLVADHDPIGLHYMLDAERPGATTWQSLADGPQLWKVRITKVG